MHVHCVLHVLIMQVCALQGDEYLLISRQQIYIHTCVCAHTHIYVCVYVHCYRMFKLASGQSHASS